MGCGPPPPNASASRNFCMNSVSDDLRAHCKNFFLYFILCGGGISRNRGQKFSRIPPGSFNVGKGRENVLLDLLANCENSWRLLPHREYGSDTRHQTPDTRLPAKLGGLTGTELYIHARVPTIKYSLSL